MTEDVKQSAYKTMLDRNDKTYSGKVRDFANNDKTIYNENEAQNEVYKNASVRRPSRLNDLLGRYMKSVGQIMYVYFNMQRHETMHGMAKMLSEKFFQITH